MPDISCLKFEPFLFSSSDANDDDVLIPGHFIIGDALTSLLDPSLIHLPENILTSCKMIQKLRQNFCKKWHKEYLHECQLRRKWRSSTTPQIQVSQLVIVKNDNTSPGPWPLGRVTEVHPGKDKVLGPLQFAYVLILCIEVQINCVRYRWTSKCSVVWDIKFRIANVFISDLLLLLVFFLLMEARAFKGDWIHRIRGKQPANLVLYLCYCASKQISGYLCISFVVYWQAFQDVLDYVLESFIYIYIFWIF